MNDSNLPEPRPGSAAARRKVKQQRNRALRNLRKVAPWLQPSDMFVARAFVRNEVMSDAIQARLKAEGYFDEAGNPRPAAEFLRRLSLANTRIAAELGLTVRSRVEIQAGSRYQAIDTDFEERVQRVHAERHGTKDEE
jgi:hypothetical protein